MADETVVYVNAKTNAQAALDAAIAYVLSNKNTYYGIAETKDIARDFQSFLDAQDAKVRQEAEARRAADEDRRWSMRNALER